MREYPYTFESWPRTQDGTFIFTCSEQAIYFAHLCSDNIEVVDKLTRLRKDAYARIAEQRSKPRPNLQRMFDLAFKAQMYRECLEEIQRINDSQYEL
ncbi:hypothetical protein ES702_06691 [subsurface metagenome]